MSPDERIHEFVRDLNRHIVAIADLATMDVPQAETDEHDRYLKRIENAEHERADLEKRLDTFLWKG